MSERKRSSENKVRKKNFVLVLNNPTTDEIDRLNLLVDSGLFRYFCGGHEIGESGTPHIQCCGCTFNPISIRALRKRIEEAMSLDCRFHIEVAKCPLPKNIQYCFKGEQPHEEWLDENEEGPNYGKNANTFEFGERPRGQGKRSDLDEVVKAISEGQCEDEIALNFGTQYIKYYRGVRELITIKKSKPRNFKTVAYWCHGPTGSGKSRWAQSVPGSVYWKTGTNKWFDGYLNQDTCIIDDYRPSKELDFNMLLNLSDRYPLIVERKGGSQHFNSRRLIITAPRNIEDTFQHLEFLQGSLDQLKRRVIEIDFSKDDAPLTLKDYLLTNPEN